jgi:hypothetical protein
VNVARRHLAPADKQAFDRIDQGIERQRPPRSGIIKNLHWRELCGLVE